MGIPFFESLALCVCIGSLVALFVQESLGQCPNDQMWIVYGCIHGFRLHSKRHVLLFRLREERGRKEGVEVGEGGTDCRRSFRRILIPRPSSLDSWLRLSSLRIETSTGGIPFVHGKAVGVKSEWISLVFATRLCLCVCERERETDGRHKRITGAWFGLSIDDVRLTMCD